MNNRLCRKSADCAKKDFKKLGVLIYIYHKIKFLGGLYEERKKNT